MKWAVIGHNILFAPRYQQLAKVMSERGVENQLEIVQCSPVEFDETFTRCQKEFDQLRIESPFREVVLKHFKQQPMLIHSLGAADCLIQRDGRWWLDAVLFYAFTQLFSRYGSKLDLSSQVLIVGAGATARLAIAAALRAGFSHINISSKFDDEGIHLVGELKARYFGVTFEFVPQDRLVLLPGTNALMINTTPLVATNDLITELSYLNFLRSDGMIWDLVVSPVTTGLVRESEQIGISCVRGYEVAALLDTQWLEWVWDHVIDEFELAKIYREAFLALEPEEEAAKGQNP